MVQLQACIERNWLLSFLTQASAKMDAFSSTELSTFIWCLAQLGHKPDPVLLDAFNRAAVKRMHTASAASVALLLQSMCVLGMVQLPAKLLTALYPQASTCMQPHASTRPVHRPCECI